jgi:hypothetical protein
MWLFLLPNHIVERPSLIRIRIRKSLSFKPSCAVTRYHSAWPDKRRAFTSQKKFQGKHIMTKPKQRRNQRNHPKPQAFGSSVSQDRTLLRATVHGDFSVTTTVGGVIAFGTPLDPSSLPNTDWADFSSTYDEFRVLGARYTIACIPLGVAITNALIAVAYDNDSTVTPSSLSQVRQYSTSKLFQAITTNKTHVFTYWRPVKGMETTIPWADVATPSGSPGSLMMYGSGMASSTTYLAVAVDFFCEFRGRR